jgi:hypothetical protein
MKTINRRSALLLDASTALMPVLPADAQTSGPMYGPKDGKEVAPGVRQVDLGESPNKLPNYSAITMRDIVMQPNSTTPAMPMANDMICHMTEGQLALNKEGEDLTMQKNHVWICTKGSHEVAMNKSNQIAVMRIIDLQATT